MNNGPAIMATVGLDRGSFKTEKERLVADLAQMGGSARETAGAIAVLERQLAGGAGSAASKQQLSDLKASYRDLTREIKLAEAQKKSLDAVLNDGAGSPPKPAASNGPDESARYEAHWKRLDEQERSRRAHAAMAKPRATEPEMYGPPEAYGPPEPPKPPLIKVSKYDPVPEPNPRPKIRIALPTPEYTGEQYGPPAPEDGGGGEEGGGGNRQRNQELFHSARAVVDSLIAGQSPLRAIEQQAPRIFQAFGTGLGALAKFAGPLAAVAAVGTLVAVVKSAHEEAVRANEELDKLGRPHGSLGGTSAPDAMRHVSDYTNPIASAQAGVDGPIGNGISNVTGSIFKALTPYLSNLANNLNSDNTALGPNFNARLGFVPDTGNTREEHLHDLQAQQAVAAGLANRAQARDNAVNEHSFSRGADVTAHEKLELEFKNKRDEIEHLVGTNPLLGDTEFVKNLREQFDLLEKIAGLEANRRSLQIHTKLDQTKIDHPSLDTSNERDDNIVLDHHQFQPKPLRKAESERSEAAAEEKATRDVGGDTRAAHQKTLDAEGRYRDAAINEELKTPEERAQERDQERTRDRAEKRLNNRTERHKQAQVDNARMDPIGDAPTIPDNASIPDNAGMVFGDIGKTTMPDRSFQRQPDRRNRSQVQPDRRVQSQVQPDRRPSATADPQAKTGAAGGFSDTNIVTELKNVTAAVKAISLKNNPDAKGGQ